MEITFDMPTVFNDIGLAKKILLELWKQCESEEFCDTVLIAGNEKKRIPVHRSVLSAASEYFHGMFTSGMLESTAKEVEIFNVNGDILQRLVEYCYTECVVISEETVDELFKAARMLQFSNVVTACENFLEQDLHPSKCLGLALLAEQHCCKRLTEKARDYSLENFAQVCDTSEFLRLNAKQLSQLLGSDDLCVRAEEDVFKSLIRWIEHDRSERVKYLAELLKLVRMPFLERSFLIEHVKPICASSGCLPIYTAAVWHLLSDSSMLSGSTLEKRRKLDQVQWTKRRKLYQFLMAISMGESGKEMFIHYYCPQRNKWMKWLKGLEYRRAFGVAVMENYLFIVGGRNNRNASLNCVIRLNLRTMTLEQMTPLNEHRAYCCAAALNGFLYVMGGWNRGHLNSVEKWNPETNKWDVVASMSTGRFNFGVAVLNKKLYAVGGISNNDAIKSVEYYDPFQNMWQFTESMSESRQSPGVAAANGMLYAVGGSGRKTVERYDPETKQWTLMCNLRVPIITFAFCTSLRDKVVVCYKDNIEELDVANNEWKKIMLLKQSDNIIGIFSYSNTLLTSEVLYD